MKVLTVVGARPEFVQTAPVSRAIRRRHSEVLVHTGQHHDDNMSAVFFADCDLPPPDHQLAVSGGLHGDQTGRMMMALEPVMLAEAPDWVLVYGDTNTTVAAALTASKLGLPLAHVEAGLRSHDRRMPEEINRVMTDHLSQLLLAPTPAAVANLEREGIRHGVELVGDVRVDIVLDTARRSRPNLEKLLGRAGLLPEEPYALATIHRPSNTDARERLTAVVDALALVGVPVVLPVHPRLGKRLREFELVLGGELRPLEPLGFVEMMTLLSSCEIVVTDSGGLQKEAYLLGRPTVTLRDTTEWTETVEAGWNRLAEPEPETFRAAILAARTRTPKARPDLYGPPGTGKRIVDRLEAHLDAAQAVYRRTP